MVWWIESVADMKGSEYMAWRHILPNIWVSVHCVPTMNSKYRISRPTYSRESSEKVGKGSELPFILSSFLSSKIVEAT